MLKISFFQMAVNKSEMWSIGIKIAFYFKNYKKSKTRKSSGGWRLRLQTHVGDTFKLH